MQVGFFTCLFCLRGLSGYVSRIVSPKDVFALSIFSDLTGLFVRALRKRYRSRSVAEDSLAVGDCCSPICERCWAESLWVYLIVAGTLETVPLALLTSRFTEA